MCNDDPLPLHQDISFQVRASVHLFHARRLREILGHKNPTTSNLEEFCKKKSGDFLYQNWFSVFLWAVIFWYPPKNSSPKIGLNAGFSKILQGRDWFRWISMWVGNLNSRVLQAWRKHLKEQCENIHAALRSMTLEVNDRFNNGGSFRMMIFAPTKIMVVRKPSTKKKGGWTSRDDYIAISHQSHEDWCFFHMSHHFPYFSYFSHAFHLIQVLVPGSLFIGYLLFPLQGFVWLEPQVGDYQPQLVSLPDFLKHQQDMLMLVFLMPKIWGTSRFFIFFQNGLVQPPTSWLLF